MPLAFVPSIHLYPSSVSAISFSAVLSFLVSSHTMFRYSKEFPNFDFLKVENHLDSCSALTEHVPIAQGKRDTGTLHAVKSGERNR